MSLLSEADLLRPKSGVQEDVLFNELVFFPPGSRAEVEVERFSCRGDHLAVGQLHLSGEGPVGAGDYSDPVATSELDWVWFIVDAYVEERANHLLNHRGVRFSPFALFFHNSFIDIYIKNPSDVSTPKSVKRSSKVSPLKSIYTILPVKININPTKPQPIQFIKYFILMLGISWILKGSIF